MDRIERIARWSRRLRGVLFVVALVLPLAHVAFWVWMGALPQSLVARALPGSVVLPLPVGARALGGMVALLPVAAAVYGLLVLQRLFGLYAQGMIFTPQNVACFRQLATALLWWAGLGFLQTPLLSMALSLHLPAGHRVIELALTTPDVTALLLGLVLRVAVWVMEEGCELHTDHSLTI
ncbi:DUF2975 domain-containing protein [Megalodesulfovibrio gigas]|uniref:DUF2975 domain-containing protein n=1 Tax=Megalodesulfovibrio gigas (strain ATCC 19364 / DSM 1382 / NCIMB 9332 / VKM B-1759) TaxID=1121448 RepID=T2GB69_MEGG1|nr:DUF2975 domain-containing protein [Megalodesulfovibrio gigas]AGW13137.1 hypothetical protein DGI_1284 [Megalodesulfovibrio gigas DSM 1382 = ATCC 19364]